MKKGKVHIFMHLTADNAIQLCIRLFDLKACKVLARFLRPIMTQHVLATDKQIPERVQTEM